MSRGRDEQLGDAEVVQSGSVPFYSTVKKPKGPSLIYHCVGTRTGVVKFG